jgi:hypothetical protein
MMATPSSNNIQFYDGYFPALKAGNYAISLAHTVTPPAGQTVPPYALTQGVVVQGPEFTIDPTTVQSQFPPNGASDIYDQQLPYLVFSDPALPWERGLVPGEGEPGPGDATPWLALVLFAESELSLPAQSDTPVVACTVAGLLASDPDTLKPSLPAGWVSPDVLQTQCQTVTIPGATFQSVMPEQADLPLLAHCRAVNVPDEPQVLLSIVLGNRLPLAGGMPVKYYAHLVSLEGFAAYLGPNARPIPPKTGAGQTGMMDVQLVSLFNWSFVSMPESGADFEQLVEGLIQSETATPTLALPMPSGTTGLPASAQARLEEGYVALDFVTGSGEQSFAWYRGPFTAQQPQPLPPVGDPAVPVTQAVSADALMIYLAEQGLFDLSYSAAWMVGRALALADGSFSQAVQNYRRSATDSLTTLSQRMAMPHFAGATDLQALLAPDATRRRFARLAAQGLPERLTGLLGAGGMEPARARSRRERRRRALSAIHPRSLLAQPDVTTAVSDNVAEDADPVAEWLAHLALLYPLPFSHLVPDARMLPVESVRFFYVDQNWLAALQAGALSIAIHSSSDVALQQALSPQLTQATARHRQRRLARTVAPADPAPTTGAGPTLMTGMLIRSQLVSGWPTLVVTASAGGVALNLARDDCPSTNVRLCLFEGVPDTVTLAEPYQGLRFGIEDNGIALRDVTTAGQIGLQITGKFLPASSANGFRSNGVVGAAILAAALASALGVDEGLGAGDLAIQVIKAPEMQQFKS